MTQNFSTEIKMTFSLQKVNSNYSGHFANAKLACFLHGENAKWSKYLINAKVDPTFLCEKFANYFGVCVCHKMTLFVFHACVRGQK